MQLGDDVRPSVLLVEDDELFATSMRALLTNAGFVVRVAESGEDCRLETYLHDCDLALIDLALPGRNGFQIVEQIRADRATADKPILMLTAHTPMTYRLQGLSLGADDFMVKPPNPKELVLRINSLLRRSASSPGEVPRIRAFGGHGRPELAIPLRDIAFVQAARNYCYLQTRTERLITNESIGQLEAELPNTFLRTHKSYIVNSAFVLGGRWETTSNYVLDLTTEPTQSVPVGRANRKHVRETLGL